MHVVKLSLSVHHCTLNSLPSSENNQPTNTTNKQKTDKRYKAHKCKNIIILSTFKFVNNYELISN